MRKRRILSLLLAVAVTVTMLIAVPLTASAAASEKYAEVTFDSNNIGADKTNAATDVKTPFEGSRINITSTNADVEPDIYYQRTLQSTGSDGSVTNNYGNTTSISKSTYKNYSTGENVETTIGWKCSGSATYGYTFVVNPNCSDNSAQSYNFKIVFSSRGSSSVALKVVDISELKTGQVNGGTDKEPTTGNLTSSSKSDLCEVEFKNLTSNISFAFSDQPALVYIGIEYNVPTGPTFGIEPSEIPIKVGETQNVTVNIEGYEGKTVNDVEWSVPEGYDKKITFGEAQENQIPVSVSADAAGDEGRVVTATATLKDTEATAELKVEIMPADPDALAKVYESTKFTFDEFDTVTSTPAPLINKKQNMKVHASSSGTISIKEGNNTLGNQDTVSKHLDLGGAGDKDKRSVEIIPGVDGAVTVYAGIGKDEERPLKIEQNGEVKGTLSLTTKDKVESMTAYVTAGQSVYIYSGRSGINIYAIYFKPMTFGEENGTDSGYYMSGETKNGVIRFFQSVDADDVSDYGFYIVKDDGTIVETKRTTNKEEATKLTGIYADLYGLPDQSGSGQEAQSKYSMKAFVTFKTSDTPVFAPESIKDATVDWDVHITDVMPD